MLYCECLKLAIDRPLTARPPDTYAFFVYVTFECAKVIVIKSYGIVQDCPGFREYGRRFHYI